jgi:hypothetical protein
MEILAIITSLTNYIALAMTIWLAWYILTRSVRQPISWLTSLTLWSISGIFINSLLAINPPPIPVNAPWWAKFLFPFWVSNVIPQSPGEWIAGWLVIPAIGFWHHVTMLIREEKWKTWHYIQVGSVYLTVLIGILAMRRTSLMYSEWSGDPLILNSLRPGILYTAFLLQLSIIILMSFRNLREGMKKTVSQMARNQIRTLSWATLTAGLTAPISFMAVRMEISLPRVLISMILAATVFMIGYSVGKYSALTEGRILRRDFIYSASAMAIVAVLYSVVIYISIVIFNVPPAAYIFILIFAFATHSIIDIARHYLDLVFYKKEDRFLRERIRKISNQVGHQGLVETLEIALDLACTSVRATFGFVVSLEEGKKKAVAHFQCNHNVSQIPREVFCSDDYEQFKSDTVHPELANVALLIPIFIREEQIGAILFGPPVNSPQYGDVEIDRLMDISEQMALMITQMELRAKLVEQVSSAVQMPSLVSKQTKGVFTTSNVEEALRNVHDYASLGNNGLATSKLIDCRLQTKNCTHLDRGKKVYEILLEAVSKLRPDDAYGESIPPREWYPYLILYSAYFEGKLNRDIMSELYISEGTFNRTRRSAIRAVTRVLVELEGNLS